MTWELTHDEAKVLAERAKRTWRRLKQLWFPCFEGDSETKNALRDKKSGIGRLVWENNSWPCSICKLSNSTECGFQQALEGRWAIFEPSVWNDVWSSDPNLKLRVTCQWCGAVSPLTLCEITPETGVVWCPVCHDRTGIRVRQPECPFCVKCHQKMHWERKETKVTIKYGVTKVEYEVLRNCWKCSWCSRESEPKPYIVSISPKPFPPDNVKCKGLR